MCANIPCFFYAGNTFFYDGLWSASRSLKRKQGMKKSLQNDAYSHPQWAKAQMVWTTKISKALFLPFQKGRSGGILCVLKIPHTPFSKGGFGNCTCYSQPQWAKAQMVLASMIFPAAKRLRTIFFVTTRVSMTSSASQAAPRSVSSSALYIVIFSVE